MVGRTISHYRILEKIGSGGMGVVYKAEDTKLDRYVALKFLPAYVSASDIERQRLVQEAKAAAALNHPNICTIYGIGDADAITFIVMELVHGQVLRQILPIQSIETALEYGIQIGEALQEAHAYGIVHRDVKPENIIVNIKGHIKVMDFGLAKLKGRLKPAETSSTPGTLAYMAPEQIWGDANAQTDIFSFGAVLYEMLTGHATFKGDSEEALMCSIVLEEPHPIEDFRQDVPQALIDLVRKCLEKNPADRCQTSLDVVVELRRIRQRLSMTNASTDVIGAKALAENERPKHHESRSHRLWRIAFIFAAVFIAFFFVLLLADLSFLDKPNGADFEFVKLTSLSDQKGQKMYPSISPDGQYIVYEKKEGYRIDIYQQRLDGSNQANLTKGSNGDNRQPAYSPSGNHIAFRSEREGGGVYIMGATGDSVRRITDFGYNPSWSPDGSKLLVTSRTTNNPLYNVAPPSLWLVDIASGDTKKIAEPYVYHPQWSPHGYRIAFWALSTISTIPAQGGSPVIVMKDSSMNWYPVWSADGRFLYFSSDRGGSMNLWKIPVDEQTGTVLGDPIPLSAPSEYCGHFAVSKSDGRIVYVSRTATTNIIKLAADIHQALIKGKPEVIRNLAADVIYPDLSPDGEWLAFSSYWKKSDLFLLRTDGSELRKLTDDPSMDRGPKWSADGTKIVFSSSRNDTMANIWLINRDGSGLEQLTKGIQYPIEPVLFPGNKTLSIYSLKEATCLIDLTVPLAERKSRPLTFARDPQISLHSRNISPDGKYIACAGAKPMGVYVYALDARTYVKLFDSLPLPTAAIYWLNDSRTIVFPRGPKVYVADIFTRKTRLMYTAPDDFGGSSTLIAASQDGSALYFEHKDVRDEIWMARPRGSKK